MVALVYLMGSLGFFVVFYAAAYDVFVAPFAVVVVTLAMGCDCWLAVLLSDFLAGCVDAGVVFTALTGDCLLARVDLVVAAIVDYN